MRVYRARAGRAGTVALLQIDVVWTEATLAQTWLGSMIASCQRVAPLAQTGITNLIAYNKLKRQGGQGGPCCRKRRLPRSAMIC